MPPDMSSESDHPACTVVGVMPHAGCDVLADALLRSGATREVLPLDSACDRLVSDRACRVIFLFREPLAAVCEALRGGHDPEAFLEQWSAAHSGLVSPLKRHRERSLLMDAASPAEAVREALCARWGITVELPPLREQPDTALERLLAAQLVAEHTTVHTTAALLAALALPLTDRNSERSSSPAEAISAYREQRRRLQAALAAEQMAQEHKNEAELLLSSLHQTQEELETYFLKARDLEEKLTSQAALIAQIREKKKALDEVVKDTRSTIAQLKRSKTQDEKTIAQLKRSKAQSEKTIAQLRKNVLSLKGRLATLSSAAMPDAGSAPVESETPASSGGSRSGLLVRMLGRKRRIATVRAKDTALLRRSELFDEAWYLRTNPDVVQAGFDAAEHYLAYGAAEGRNPSPGFDTLLYVQNHPDVAAANKNPLLHYLKNGRAEGRTIHPATNA